MADDKNKPKQDDPHKPHADDPTKPHKDEGKTNVDPNIVDPPEPVRTLGTHLQDGTIDPHIPPPADPISPTRRAAELPPERTVKDKEEADLKYRK